ncbi:hypothetical protein [Actinomadura nitritigenes]|uniref:hypothetical protein n=1 Tax=Actinomadura nitritigenes TaxID=134602 RepID=UPI003D92283B
MTPRVLCHLAPTPALRDRLGPLLDGLDVRWCAEDDEDRFAALLPGTDVLWHVLRPVTADDLDRAPGLRLIQKLGSGVNTIDLDAARARGVTVANMVGANAPAVAEAALTLRDQGFRAIIAPSFADIFRGNLPNSGLVPVQAAPAVVAALLAAATADPATEIVVDVAGRTVRCEGVCDAPFELDASAHHRLVHGLDEIDLTLARDEAVTAYERTRPPWLPTGRPAI